MNKMIQNMPNTNTLPDVNQLEDLLGTLDQIHTAVSENGFIFRSPMERHDLIALLREVAYTVDETIHELERTTPFVEFRLHIVEKPSA
jgi:hypothetical protein